MFTAKKGIQLLAHICKSRGIKKVVFSPGSRSAPLVIAFSCLPEIECIVIPDERVAGYFALGMAQQSAQPVAVVCTSGTAVLNLGPAVCEAYYQNVKLLLLTADRPAELIGMGENQAIHQNSIYSNYIHKSYNIPAEETENGSNELDSLYNQAIDILNGSLGIPGPVHINLQLREPLYNQTEQSPSPAHYTPPSVTEEKITTTLAGKTLIIAGLMPPDPRVEQHLNTLASYPNIVVVTESTSNVQGPSFIYSADSLLAMLDKDEEQHYAPEVVLHIGGQIVSKRLKEFLKRIPLAKHLHIYGGPENWNSFKAATFQKIKSTAAVFLENLVAHNKPLPSTYAALWRSKYEQAKQAQNNYLQQAPYSDMKVFETLVQSFPAGCCIQYGNSSPVRYSNFFQHGPTVQVSSNRGTSGIDGCVSTAAGAAYSSGKLTINIVGDVSFFYDSNALWNNYLSPHLRIVIINNSGGNIFRLIEGPAQVNNFEKFFETRHHLSAQHLALMYGIPYYFCNAQNQLNEVLKTFYGDQNGKPAILEIKTDGILSAEVFKNYWHTIKKG